MSEWWSYRLEDFLLFAPRVYWRLIEAQNAALWPLHVASVGAGLAIVLLVARRPQNAMPWTGLVLAAVWAFVGWSFLLNRYAAINWAILYIAPAFFLQSALLAIAAVLPRGLTIDGRAAGGRTGLLVALAGLLLYPCLPLVSGHPWTSAEVFGIAPDPTAIVTLGLLLAARGPLLAVLLPIPLFWCLFSGLTLLAMDEVEAWLLLATAAFVPILVLVGRRRPQT
ncbi:DUF6064 family protein [Bosea sp. 117]|uniref:DUF6064 family protein n=1 Tax=Bosea sp. 117 TaxID=1125973 RepID=UPI000571AA99|nr:DUF6064 family protein [Bosea sp. 117]